jgi:hypothetical protein
MAVTNERGDRHENFFGKTAVAMNAEDFAVETNRFLAAQAEFALAAK